jgi:hypothetical protein
MKRSKMFEQLAETGFYRVKRDFTEKRDVAGDKRRQSLGSKRQGAD